ncbi:MAG TPA: hypothetical protein VJ722_10025 [Rhodanobacteraceae bacterium]|nr:hypothetical protein [Rhodanobacteraceae bacterium]
MRKLILPALIAVAFASPGFAHDAQSSPDATTSTEQAPEPVVSSDVKRLRTTTNRARAQSGTSAAPQGPTPASTSAATTQPPPAPSTSG